MSSAGTANSLSSSSPRKTRPATTRRRVAENYDLTERFSNISVSDVSEDEEEDPNDFSSGSYHHHCYHHYHNRRQIPLTMRETCLHNIEDGFYWTVDMVKSLTSGRNVVRKIFGCLLLMMVLLVFVKVSFLTQHVKVSGTRRENGLLVIKTFRDDWAMAQNVVAETQTPLPRRVLERLSVSKHFLFQKIDFLFLKILLGSSTCRLVLEKIEKNKICVAKSLPPRDKCNFSYDSHIKMCHFPQKI